MILISSNKIFSQPMIKRDGIFLLVNLNWFRNLEIVLVKYLSEIQIILLKLKFCSFLFPEIFVIFFY